MFSNFFKKNSSTLLIVGALLFLFVVVRWFGRDDTAILLDHPQTGQIYIFHEDNLYAPMRLDSVGTSQLFFRNYIFLFADAVPAQEQILADEFDLQFMAIYEKTELIRLYQEGLLVKIYTP